MTQKKPFNYLKAVRDEQSSVKPAPEEAKVRPNSELGSTYSYYVPVSFVAKDWKVTSRRIRALLTEGRLMGRQQDNGYWEVRYPYLHTIGRAGPPLRRNQRPKKAEGNPVLKLIST